MSRTARRRYWLGSRLEAGVDRVDGGADVLQVLDLSEL
jgi:hypothetical protein